MKKLMIAASVALCSLCGSAAEMADTTLLRYVNPFIGTTNFGTCNPGAVVPTGMMSVVPFNVMGSDDNRYDKDARWWSTPYEYTNKYLTGFSHV
ncbi:MAG: glycoside hydrolase family 92 protein, partial [Muribaculaceae bacterium]|nr:glycoside hydrolase family 92 protein [Muribaculaceae bacterium]